METLREDKSKLEVSYEYVHLLCMEHLCVIELAVTSLEPMPIIFVVLVSLSLQFEFILSGICNLDCYKIFIFFCVDCNDYVVNFYVREFQNSQVYKIFNPLRHMMTNIFFFFC
jgi:hypothetical protein